MAKNIHTTPPPNAPPIETPEAHTDHATGPPHNRHRHSPNEFSIIVGALLIVLGLLFLGRELNWWTVDIGHILATFWPVVLILFGVRLLLPRGRLYSWIIALVIIGGAALFTLTPSPYRRDVVHPRPTESAPARGSFSQSYQSTTKTLKIDGEFGGTKLTINSLGSDSDAYAIKGTYENSKMTTTTSKRD